MTIAERVELYRAIFADCKALEAVVEHIQPEGRVEALEAIRKLNTELSSLYMVSIPVITVWVRDNSYVSATEEIYLTEPDLESFLHQFRHHLQNIERRYERRGLTVEGDLEIMELPYSECVYKLRGEDDAIAWGKFLVENSSK